MNYLIFFAGAIVGGLAGILIAGLMDMAGRGERQLEKYEAALQDHNAGTPEAGYHPGSLSDPRD